MINRKLLTIFAGAVFVLGCNVNTQASSSVDTHTYRQMYNIHTKGHPISIVEFYPKGRLSTWCIMAQYGTNAPTMQCLSNN